MVDSFESGITGCAKDYPMRCNRSLDEKFVHLPSTLMKSFEIFLDDGDGEWKPLSKVDGNIKRLWRAAIDRGVKRIRVIPTEAHGAEKAGIYSVIVK